MTIRWTQPANDDFLGIVAWIAANNPAAASKVGRRILKAVEQLNDFPLRGRPGRSPDTRELVISGLPYLGHLQRRVRPAHRGHSPGAAWGDAVASRQGIKEV
jgi:plasmid stabilization system protein ParE